MPLTTFALAGKLRPVLPSPIEGAVHVLDVIEAAVESSETGRAIRIKRVATTRALSLEIQPRRLNE